MPLSVAFILMDDGNVDGVDCLDVRGDFCDGFHGLWCEIMDSERRLGGGGLRRLTGPPGKFLGSRDTGTDPLAHVRFPGHILPMLQLFVCYS